VKGTVHLGPNAKLATIQALGEMMRLVNKQFCEACKGDGGHFRCSLGCEIS
jgi:hypothetical protein